MNEDFKFYILAILLVFIGWLATDWLEIDFLKDRPMKLIALALIGLIVLSGCSGQGYSRFLEAADTYCRDLGLEDCYSEGFFYCMDGEGLQIALECGLVGAKGTCFAVTERGKQK